ncbi:MAG: ABC transporter permease [Bacteroidales bacterium]|nr:ABC transporter permease [Bacteroidales bacterium]
MMNLPFFIARRYLFARKSHNVINIISLISAVGIGIGSMALIVILSVYNGFDTLVKSFYQEYQPHFIITPQQGKSFHLNEPRFDAIREIDGIGSLQPVVEEDIFVQYGNNQAVAFIRGVEPTYGEASGIAASVKEGEFKTYMGQTPHAIVGRELAASLRLRVRFLDALELYFPSRSSAVSLLNPQGSLNSETLFPSAIIAHNNEFDANGLYIPLDIARNLLEYSDDEVTSLEIYLKKEALPNAGNIEKELRKILDSGISVQAPGHNSSTDQTTAAADKSYVEFIIKNKYQQNETLYKMMRAEKFAVYMILFFVVIIVSVNIFGSLSMLILDKKEDLKTFSSMGARPELIKRIFVLQGWLISLIGSAIGIVIGVALCIIQQQTGLISLPGNYIVSAYPVEIHVMDIIITFAGVAIIGYIIAILPSKVIK